jgi:hypothetical protein
MHSNKLSMITFLLFGCAVIVPLRAAPAWTPFGLKGETVNTILTLPAGLGDDAIMVGTSNGIRCHAYGVWQDVMTGLPVYDFCPVSGYEILAAAGNGSDTDGIYLGKVIAWGEPGVWWQFKLLVKYPRPTAVAYLASGAMGGRCDGTLFAGNASGVRRGALCDDSVEGFAAMTAPAGPWSQCAALFADSTDRSLWAGGNYNNVLTNVYAVASLLRGTGELTEQKKLNVIDVFRYSSERDTFTAVATVDSGVVLYKNGAFRSRVPTRTITEPMLAVVPFPTQSDYGYGKWTMLIGATPSGVFRQCPPTADCIWGSGFGPLIPRVNCLAQYQGRVLWAGTDSGVYRYEFTTGTVLSNALRSRSSAVNVQAISTGAGAVRVRIAGSGRALLALRIFDTRGRMVKSTACTAGEVTVTGLGKGCYPYLLTSGISTVASGIVVRK